MHFVQFFERVQRFALDLIIKPSGVFEEQDRISAGAEWDAGVGRGQKAGTPVRSAATRPFLSRAEYHVAGQILRFAAKAIRHPRTKAWPPKLLRTGVHEDLRGRMIESIRLHRLYDRNIVRD